jgi:hypothetical protein
MDSVTGITSLQAMQYFSRYKHDGWYNKLSVRDHHNHPSIEDLTLS